MNILHELGIRPVNALWLVLALAFVWMLYRFGSMNKEFRLVDLFMNHTVKPPRADNTSVILFMFALMAIWICVDRSNAGKDVDNLVLGVLSIFVLRQAFKIGADAYRDKPAAPEPEVPASRDVNVNVAPSSPLAKSEPVPVQVKNPEPIKVTQTDKSALVKPKPRRR